MYRQEVRRKVVGTDVVRFMMYDKEFPRSVAFCVDKIMQYASTLPNPMDIIAMIDTIEHELNAISPKDVTAEGTNKHMDDLQKMLCDLNNIIEDSWFYNNNEI